MNYFAIIKSQKKGEKENFEKIIRREIFRWNTKYLIFFSLIIIILEILRQNSFIWYIIYRDIVNKKKKGKNFKYELA